MFIQTLEANNPIPNITSITLGVSINQILSNLKGPHDDVILINEPYLQIYHSDGSIEKMKSSSFPYTKTLLEKKSGIIKRKK